VLECSGPNRVTFILQTTTQEDAQALIETYLRRRVAELERSFVRSPIIAVSRPFPNLSGAPRAYRSCDQRITEALFYGEGPIVGDREDGSTDLVYVGESQQAAISERIRRSDPDGARAVIEEILATHVGDKDTRRAMYACFTVFTTIMQTISDSPAAATTQLDEFRDRVDAFFSARELAGFTRALFDLAGASCAAIDRIKKSHNTLLLEKIDRFLEANVGNPALYVPTVADEFSLHPKYVASFYKEQRGITLTARIQKLRVERVKELLTGGGTVKRAAAAAGFGSLVTLNRAFRRVEGITPTEFKEQLRISRLSGARSGEG
jgi:AraC-like DNA-binding protein